MNEIIEPTFDANLIQVIFALLISWIFIIGIRSFQTIFSKWKDYKFPLLLLLPSLIAIFLVVIYPFAYNVLISVSNFSLRTFRDWQIVGFQHYVEVLTDSQFYLILTKTILWTVTNVFMHVTIGIFLALIINQTLPAKPLFRILLIIPWAVPQYITALTWRGLFNQEYGPINIFLSEYLNLSPLQWLSDPFLAFVSCFITNVWLGFPFMMMVALGGLQSIPKHLYEAAMVDGANHWQRFRMITWPLLQPVMRPAIVLGSIWTFNSLNVIWLVSNSGEPADQTHILVSYVYKSAFNLYRFSYSSALSMLIFLILLSFGQWFMMKQNQNEEILK